MSVYGGLHYNKTIFVLHLLRNLSFDFQMVGDVKKGAKTHSPAVQFF